MSAQIRNLTPLLHLRTLPVLRDLAPYQVAHLAREAEAVMTPAGACLRRSDEAATSVHMIMEGTLEIRREGHLEHGEPGGEVGLAEVLAGEVTGTEVRAQTDVVTLSLDGEVLRDAAERYAALLLRLLQEVARRLTARPSVLLAAVQGPGEPRPLGPELDRVGRILALHRAPAFPSESMDALAELAGPRSERHFPAGSELWDLAMDADTFYVVCAGTIDYIDGTGQRLATFRQGAVPGLPQVLCGGPRLPYRAVAVDRVVALEVERELFLDVVEDHFELGWSLLSRLAGHILAERR